MKKAAVAALLLAAVLLTAGGMAKSGNTVSAKDQNGEAAEDAEAERISQIDTSVPVTAGSRIAVVSKNVKGEFWDMVHSGMNSAVKDLNTAFGLKGDDQIKMTFEGPDDEQNVEEQVNTLDAVIAENPAVLCLSASDMDSCQAQIETSNENGIPVIVFDSNVSDSEMVSAFRGTDNEKVGELGAQKMAEALGETGKVVVFAAQEKTESAQKRVNTFATALGEYPDMELCEVIYMDQVDDMSAAMAETLEKIPDLDGVFCTNAEVADLYLDVKKDEEHQPVMIGVDATTSQQAAVKDGREYGIVSQDPYEMGYQTILAASETLKQPEVETDVEETDAESSGSGENGVNEDDAEALGSGEGGVEEDDAEAFDSGEDGVKEDDAEKVSSEEDGAETADTDEELSDGSEDADEIPEDTPIAEVPKPAEKISLLEPAWIDADNLDNPANSNYIYKK